MGGANKKEKIGDTVKETFYTKNTKEENKSTSVDSKGTNLLVNSDHLPENKMNVSIRNLANLFKKGKKNDEDGKENKNVLLDSEGTDLITNSDINGQVNPFKKKERNVEADKKEEKIGDKVEENFYTKN